MIFVNTNKERKAEINVEENGVVNEAKNRIITRDLLLITV